MSKNKSEIIEIARTGADLVISASKLTKSEIIEIIRNIQSGSKLEICDTERKTKSELIEIANSAPKRVLTLHL